MSEIKKSDVPRQVASIDEIWRDVPGYEGLYQVSDYGRVLGLKRANILSPSYYKGYGGVSLSSNGVLTRLRIHEIVALAFIGEKPEGMEVNHIDRDRSNNRASNLEYVTHKRNMEHSIEHMARGEDAHNATLTTDQVLDILASSKSVKELAAEYEVGAQVIYAIVSGRTWKHIPRVNVVVKVMRKLSPQEKAYVDQSTESVTVLAKRLGVSPQAIYRRKWRATASKNGGKS